MGTVSATGTLATLALGLAAPHQGAPPPLAPPPLDSADVRAWLDSLVPAALQSGDIPGALVVIVKDGRVLVQRGYGYADVARKTPIDPATTIMSVGSVSKLFAWTAAMQQVAAGKLDLDGDVNDRLDFRIPDAFGRPITLRHLMTHTAGFEERAFRTTAQPRPLAEYLLETPVPTRIFPPGEVVAYSNYGSMLAGHLVELASGERFPDYVERHILAPLGMTRSSFRRPLPPERADDLAWSYQEASGEPDPRDALDREEPNADPSGHFTTTGADIARFMLAHLQHGRLDSVRILDSAAADLMHAAAFEPVPGAHPITLGFFRTDRNGRRSIAHAGDIEGFHADLELLPEEQIGLFVVVNGSGASRGLFRAGHQLRSTLFPRFMDRYFPAPPPPEEPTLPTAGEHARMVAGEYQMSRRGTGDFTELAMLLARAQMKLVLRASDDGTIVTPPMLDFEGGRERTWREVAPFVWREVGGTERIFMRIENGRVVSWVPEHLFSFVLQPVAPSRRARPNVVLMVSALAVLAAAALGVGIAALVSRRRKGTLPPAARSLGVAAAVGFGYLLLWGWLITSGATDRDGGETWIRIAQAVGLVALAAAVVSVRGLWLILRNRRGPLAVLGGLLVVLAMAETAWLSLGFHLLSWRLIY